MNRKAKAKDFIGARVTLPFAKTDDWKDKYVFFSSRVGREIKIRLDGAKLIAKVVEVEDCGEEIRVHLDDIRKGKY